MRKVVFFIIFLINFCLFFSEFSFAEIFFAPEGFSTYQVKKGDVLGKIAPCEHWDLIKRVNRVDESHLPAGKSIFIPINPEKANRFIPIPKTIEKAKNQKRILYIFLDRQYFGAYENGHLSFWGPISSGKKGLDTPVGNFSVKWKTGLYKSKKYDAEMPFAINISDAGFFIHQQSLPGKPASHGCIRLLKEDAQKMYNWIKKNDPVVIK
ncbi:MAG TPA: L,D-transpeptidase family protein [Candidatus Moranbacteria bacterium]|nr:L,D-transpeptidase family protein [Candidatus Moranbacteria bacterium]HRZ33984.1 L,D-transpeptidase family protein [Candidatus Moranbacteria bacterium]